MRKESPPASFFETYDTTLVQWFMHEADEDPILITDGQEIVVVDLDRRQRISSVFLSSSE
jgi:hypothetical protein